MDKETYEAQRAFAGEKKASMKRRCVGHDYTRPATYMLTMTVEGRRPLFARIQGTSSKPHVELTPLWEADFPPELIVNDKPDLLFQILDNGVERFYTRVPDSPY